MATARVISRVSRSVAYQRSLLLLSASQKQNRQLAIFSNQFHSLAREYPNKIITNQMPLFHHSFFSASRFGFTSSASPEPTEKEQGSTVENNAASTNGDPDKTNGNAKLSDQAEHSVSGDTKESGFNSESQPTMSESLRRRRSGTKRTAFSDSDSDSDAEGDLSMDDLVKLVAEKEDLLMQKHKEIEVMKDKVLRTCAEMENIIARTKREAENSKKFAIQNFAKSLLDVSDNLGRASSVVKSSFLKIDVSNDTAGAVPLLKTLLEGVEMTEKQLAEVFKKFGVEKYDPTNEPFDPHRHNAVFRVPDASKPPGTVATVLKAGYMLHDRVIRPAEVGVTHAVENDAEINNEGDKGS